MGGRVGEVRGREGIGGVGVRREGLSPTTSAGSEHIKTFTDPVP